MAIPADVQAALDRLPAYNSNAYSLTTNPRGLAYPGHITEFPRALTDFATVANWLETFSDGIAAVDENSEAIQTIALIGTEIEALGGIKDELVAIYGVRADVVTVAGIGSDVSAVALVSGSVSTVATNITAVTTAADNMAAIQAAPAAAQTATDKAAAADASAGAAATSAGNAAASESNASGSATAAAGSASDAAGSATSAAGSASAAQTAKTGAETAQGAAEAARDQTLASFDSFDDRYLGSKASDPATDNDGNPLVAGAIYFSSTDGAMRVYTGSAWVAAYVSGTDFYTKTESDNRYALQVNLSAVAFSGAYGDLSGRPPIPDSPGDIGAATAAQGSKADSALQPSAVGTGVGDLLALVDVGGAPGLPPIDGSQLTGVATEVPEIRTPDLIAPADDATGTDLTPTLEAGVYRSLYGVAHAASQWQVATDSGFASLVHDQTTGAVTEWAVPSNLATVTEYFWRVRYQDSEGTWSEWPDASSFTTADIYVAQPSVTAPPDASVDIGETPTLTSSAFNVVNGSDTHASSDWEIRLSADDSLVWSSTGDTGNLEAITVPEGQLSVSTGYKARVRHTGDTFGTSAWSPYIGFTTADAFTQVVGVALVTSGGGGGTWAHIDEAGNDFAANSTYFNQHPVFGGIVDETIDGQAMVKIPAFYYKVSTGPAGSDHAGETCWWVGDGPFDGATLHPAFMLSSVEVDQFWVGKYQGTNDGGSKLGSQAGNTPLVSIDITQFRSRASARNVSGVSGFMLWSIYQLGAIQMLYLVEYANGDSQAAIGDGRVNQSSAAAVDAADVAQATYRGIVGLWGNVYQAVDGVEFTSSNEVQIWSEDGGRTLISTGVTAPAYASGQWVHEQFDDTGVDFDLSAAFITSNSVGSEASSTFADAYYGPQSGEQNVYFHGGYWSGGADAGLFFANCSVESSHSSASIGGRLARVT